MADAALAALCAVDADDREAVCDAARRVAPAIGVLRRMRDARAREAAARLVPHCSPAARDSLASFGATVDAPQSSSASAGLKQTAVDAAALAAFGAATGNAHALLRAAETITSSGEQHPLDALLAKCYYLADVVSPGSLDDARRMVALRLASVGHASEAAGVLANAAVRALLRAGAWDAAARLLARTTVAADVSAATAAKRHYYAAQVAAVAAGDYERARDHLFQAGAKTHGAAKGFRAAVQRLLLVVELLAGADVLRPRLEAPALAPYLPLARAVRRGDLAAFEAAASAGAAQFGADGTSLLVARLPARVVQTGVLRIAAAYRRVPVDAVQAMLGLPSRSDALAVVRKALSDGLFAGDVLSVDGTEVLSVRPPHRAYYSGGPTHAALDERVQAANGLRAACVRAMRYAAGPHEPGARPERSAEGRPAGSESESSLSGSDVDIEDAYIDEDLI